jgi:site-specific recombinase XerD
MSAVIVPAVLPPARPGAVAVLPAGGTRTLLAATRDPWAALVALWLDSGFSLRTREAYGRAVAEWTAACQGWGVTPLEASRPHVDRWARELEAAGQASTTVSRKLSSVASVYSYAVDEGILAASPAARVRRPKTADRHQAPGLSLEEARLFLAAAAADGPRTEALIGLLLRNGLRVSEAIDLDVTDLDTERGHRIVRLVGKGAKAAVVVLAPATAHAIDIYLVGRVDGPLFATSTGRRLDRPAVWRKVRQLARRAGLPQTRLSPHSMRATAITLLLDAGTSLRDAQDFARHADPRTTRGYDRARGNLDRHGTYTLSAYLGE